MIRPYALVILVFLGLHCFAQGPQRVHLFECNTVVISSEKMIMEQMRSMDDKAATSIQGNILKVKLSADIQRQRVLAVLNEMGIGDFVILATNRTTEASSSEVPPFPLYIDTGSPSQDDATYDEAKRAWILDYPEAYELMNLGGQR